MPMLDALQGEVIDLGQAARPSIGTPPSTASTLSAWTTFPFGSLTQIYKRNVFM